MADSRMRQDQDERVDRQAEHVERNGRDTILREAHSLYDLAERIRFTNPRAARHLEQAADLMLRTVRH